MLKTKRDIAFLFSLYFFSFFGRFVFTTRSLFSPRSCCFWKPLTTLMCGPDRFLYFKTKMMKFGENLTKLEQKKQWACLHFYVFFGRCVFVRPSFFSSERGFFFKKLTSWVWGSFLSLHLKKIMNFGENLTKLQPKTVGLFTFFG